MPAKWVVCDLRRVSIVAFALLTVLSLGACVEPTGERRTRSPHDAADGVARELRQFAGLLDVYSLEHPVPRGALREIARQLEEAGDLPFKPSELPMIWRNCDPWGNPFRMRLDRDSGQYRIWSVGPNGIDEDGGGDDLLAVTSVLPKLAETQPR
jgi:hypothetical protein